MASGSYAKKPRVQTTTEVRSTVPARATRDLSAENADDDGISQAEALTFSRESTSTRPPVQTERPTRKTARIDSVRTTGGTTTRITGGTTTRITGGATTRTTSNIARNTANITSTKSLPAIRTPNTTQILPAEPQSPNTTRVLEGLTTTNNTRILPATKINRTVDIDGAITRDPRPPIKHLEKHKSWLHPWLICFIFAIVSLLVLISAGMFQRVNTVNLFGGGQTYNIQVGGSQAQDWQKATPAPIKPAVIKHSTGPYAVIGKPTITPAFINKVLAAYHSPAAGKGQALYDLGIQYNIDPAFALAFFMHESSFGTMGEARATLSLGNLRCIPDHACVDQDRGGYAQMASWEDGFKTWYSLIHNLYVVQSGRDTVDTIIPMYAPTADHNDEQAYINSLKRAIDTWRSGVIFVS
ncbi:hypothetical protein KDH_49660 [Dictyobacter sp. S3.2.2.5]|uniref:Mannosyl-glycoprotein endo-beta-N-acetylglucosamidase-like domain-containing protein n=1 Tax=Dictyobacter halimunensis TaxID=3026934 RepID=A0ABQ6FWD8_9CHLR|nr:hypothetical protein KDH_49660 [Dictyobacter sp. S3.2.2.5]